MYRIWYWAMIDREGDGRFIASIPDLGDVAARGSTEKDALAHLTDLAPNVCGLL
jgi:predicted RNase H-like HicB family nuclease